MQNAAVAHTSQARRISAADWSEIRETTIAAHETPSLFESISDSVQTGDDHDEFETEAGVPVSAYSSPVALWEMKRGLYNDAGARKRGLWSRMKWGVISHACEELGLESRRPEGVFIHPEIDVMSSRVDMEVTSDGGAEWLPLVAYNVAGVVADSWRNAVGDWVVPEHVEIQAQHHMAVSGVDRCYVVALIGGVNIRTFVVERDEELIEDIEGAVQDFWAAVTEDRRPASAAGRDAQVLARLCSRIDPKTKVVDFREDEELLKMIEEKVSLSAQKTALEKRIKDISAKLNVRMEGVGAALIGDTRQLAWNYQPEKEMSFTRRASAHLSTKKITQKAAGTLLEELASR